MKPRGLLLVLLATLLLTWPLRADELTRSIQEQLYRERFYSGPIDGNPNQGLTDALKSYQAHHGLPATGTLDGRTAQAMDDENGTAKQQSPAPPLSTPAKQASAPVVANAVPSPAAVEQGAVLESTAGRTPSAQAGTTPLPPQATAAPAMNAAARPMFTPESASVSPPDHSVPPAIVPSPAVVSTPPGFTGARSSPTVPPADNQRDSARNSAGATVSETPPSQSPVRAAETEAGSPPPGNSDFNEQSVARFIEQYMRAGESNKISEQTRYFSYPADYFDHRKVNARYIRRDTAAYVKRWPTRHYLLTEPVKVTLTGPDTATAEFTIAFAVENKKRRANGRTSVRATVRNQKGALKITAIGEQRLQDEPRP